MSSNDGKADSKGEMAEVSREADQVSLVTSYWPELLKCVPALPVSQPHDITVECGICLDELQIAGIHFDGFASERASRLADVPIVLPCGHLVGRRCLTFLRDSPREGTDRRDWRPLYDSKASAVSCPLCRYPLNHSGCGHWIMGIPAPIFRDETLDVVPALAPCLSSVPVSCSSCDKTLGPWPATQPPSLFFGCYNEGVCPYWEAVDSDVPYDRSKGISLQSSEQPEEEDDSEDKPGEWESFVRELESFDQEDLGL